MELSFNLPMSVCVEGTVFTCATRKRRLGSEKGRTLPEYMFAVFATAVPRFSILVLRVQLRPSPFLDRLSAVVRDGKLPSFRCPITLDFVVPNSSLNDEVSCTCILRR